MIQGTHKDLEPYVSDITGRIPIFGYPLLAFKKKKLHESYWAKIASTITNPNVNNQHNLIKELLEKYEDANDFIKFINKAFAYGKDLGEIGNLDQLWEEFIDITMSEY